MKFIIFVWGFSLIFSITESSRVEREIEVIVRDTFQHCSLIFIVLRVDTTHSTTKFSIPVNLKLFRQEKYLIGLRSNFSSANSIYSGLVDVHKYRDKCTCAIISLFGFENQTPPSLVNLYRFLKSLDGIIKLDEDYFIFHSNESSTSTLDRLLISEPFALGIKYKVVVSGGDKTTCKTACFYCNMGEPSVRQWKIKVEKTPSIKFLYPDLLENFQGRTFRVSSAVLSRSAAELNQTATGIWKNVRGIFGTALEYLSDKYNFSCAYFPSTGGGGTGLKLENGTWIGAVGDVISGLADIGGLTANIYPRNLHVAFTFPVQYAWLTFTTGLPQRRYSWKVIYWPFTPIMWSCILLALLTTYFAYSLLLRLSGQFLYTSTKLEYILKTILEQDAPSFEERSLNSTRTFLAFWLLFAFLISVTYKSKLVSILAFPIMDEPPKTFEQLARSPPSFEIILQSLRGAAYTILKTSTNPIFHQVFKRMQTEESPLKCFQRVIASSSAACISWNAVLNFVLHTNMSDKYGNVPLIMAPDTTSFVLLGYAVKKRAIFRLKFDQVLMRAVDMGLTEEWMEIDNRFLMKRRRVLEESLNTTRVSYDGDQRVDDNLSVKHLSGTFYMLLLGLFGGLTCFVTEKAWDFRKQKKESPSLLKKMYYYICMLIALTKKFLILIEICRTFTTNVLLETMRLCKK
ncbi:unnamed protein product [Orchesella dallaii]|uniref:Ionotropic glutamate receptor C-terminal domain-containing protein n=1 Tax=Orchesella dallaii TaxID=48710 RepID=A0ABP1QCC6_9HEXA